MARREPTCAGGRHRGRRDRNDRRPGGSDRRRRAFRRGARARPSAVRTPHRRRGAGRSAAADHPRDRRGARGRPRRPHRRTAGGARGRRLRLPGVQRRHAGRTRLRVDVQGAAGGARDPACRRTRQRRPRAGAARRRHAPRSDGQAAAAQRTGPPDLCRPPAGGERSAPGGPVGSAGGVRHRRHAVAAAAVGSPAYSPPSLANIVRSVYERVALSGGRSSRRPASRQPRRRRQPRGSGSPS